jgi:ribonuclease HI
MPMRGIAGIGVVVRDAAGHVLMWRCLRAPARSNNEAEYQAVISGLGLLLAHYPGRHAICLTDSRIVVEQLAGRSAVRAAALQPLHARAAALASQCASLRLLAIPRELNQLADALAWEALSGRQQIAGLLRRDTE